MVIVRLKGVYTVTAKGKTYHYAWRGGPRLEGEPGSPEFISSYQRAHAGRKAPATGTFKAVIDAYRAQRLPALGAATQRAYRVHLTQIEERWGDAPLAALDDPRIRRDFIAWRDEMADRPRTADMAIGVLKTLLSWAEERVHVHSNQAAPISRLHKVDKSEDIWTPEDFAKVERFESRELRWAVELGALTGLRQGDLIRLAWGHDEGDVIAYRTSKRGKRVMIPVTPALRALLGRIERRGPVILTTRRGKRPWTEGGLRASFRKECERVGIERTFHDLRRTAATILLSAGIEAPQLAMIMGWSEKEIEALKRRYVSREAVVKSVLAKLG